MSTALASALVFLISGFLWIGIRYWRWRRSVDADQQDVSPEWLVENSYTQDGDEPWKK
jgi:hypothetical protein